MTVDYSEVVIVILLTDDATRVLAKGADLIFERLGVSDQFRFVQHIVDPLHDLTANFDSHADIHRPRLMGDMVVCTEPFQPIGASPPGGDHGMMGRDLEMILAVVDKDAAADFTRKDYIRAFIAK